MKKAVAGKKARPGHILIQKLLIAFVLLNADALKTGNIL
jgi:hypothetical protein